jgi:hypothetical protein
MGKRKRMKARRKGRLSASRSNGPLRGPFDVTSLLGDSESESSCTEARSGRERALSDTAKPSSKHTGDSSRADLFGPKPISFWGEPSQESHEATWWIRERILPGLLALIIFGIFLAIVFWASPIARAQSIEESCETTEMSVPDNWITTGEIYLSSEAKADTTSWATIRWAEGFEIVPKGYTFEVGYLDQLEDGRLTIEITHGKLKKPLSVDCVYETSRTVITVERE